MLTHNFSRRAQDIAKNPDDTILLAEQVQSLGTTRPATTEKKPTPFSGCRPQAWLVVPVRSRARHDRATREVEFNARLRAFAKHWGFRPHACAPYRARTKGKDERGVGYVKKNAIAGRRFESWSALEAHLEGWVRDVADQRVHGTTGEVPIERFRRAEAGALRSIAGVPPFERARELVRKVQADCVIEVDSNAYSVPWRLIGESVRVVITGDQLRISHAGREVALHHCQTGRFARVVDPVHFDGVVGSGAKARRTTDPVSEPIVASELLRPLLEYERAVGGRW